MQLNQLRTNTKKKKIKRIGRGGKRGTYSGRGIKGQKARAGRRIRPEVRDVIKKIPKKRGYFFQRSFEIKPVELNLSILNKNFENNQKITPKILCKKGLVKKNKGKIPAIKILSTGSINKTLIISGCKVSKNAREKIEKVGGKII